MQFRTEVSGLAPFSTQTPPAPSSPTDMKGQAINMLWINDTDGLMYCHYVT